LNFTNDRCDFLGRSASVTLATAVDSACVAPAYTLRGGPAIAVIGYFNFLAVAFFSWYMLMSEYLFHSNAVIALLQFLFGCTILAGLIWFSTLSSESSQEREEANINDTARTNPCVNFKS
jgi:hypothetical protein